MYPAKELPACHAAPLPQVEREAGSFGGFWREAQQVRTVNQRISRAWNWRNDCLSKFGGEGREENKEQHLAVREGKFKGAADLKKRKRKWDEEDPSRIS